MRWWDSNNESGIDQSLDYAAYCYANLLCCPCYYNLRRIHQTSSYDHLGVPRIHPSISACKTRSFTHLGVSCLRTSIPTSQPAIPPPSVSGYLYYRRRVFYYLNNKTNGDHQTALGIAHYSVHHQYKGFMLSGKCAQ